MRQDLWTQEDTHHEALLRDAVTTDDLAGALLAIEGAPEVRWGPVRSRLFAWGDAASRLVGQPLALLPYEALARVLGEDAGFRGDTEDYGHPRNSQLTSVIARRAGLPIVLSSIYTIVGRHAGFDMAGVGMPGHFIVRVGDTLLDPFDGGSVRTQAQCRALVHKITAGAFAWRPEFLADTATQPTIERVLRNLLHAHQQLHQRVLVYRTARLLSSVTPDRADTQLLHARLAEEFGAHRLALDLYEAVIEAFPESPEARLAAPRLGPLHTRTRMLH